MRSSIFKYFFSQINKHINQITLTDLDDYFILLKENDNIVKQTKRNKWNIIIAFLNWYKKRDENYNIEIEPVKPKEWGLNGKGNGNRQYIATQEEIETILNHCAIYKPTYHTIFKLFIVSGCRKGGILKLKLDQIFPNKQCFNTTEKTSIEEDDKTYYFHKSLITELKTYISMRKKVQTESPYLFINPITTKRYSDRAFNLLLKGITKKYSLTQHITVNTFRHTINNNRRLMKVSKEDREFLMNQVVHDVNVEAYTNLTHDQKLKIYEDSYPYAAWNI
jgi:integrase